MQLTNPTWIHHSGGAIYSIDIHPNGSKVATSGQGSDARSGQVVIWNVKPVINEKKAQDASCSRLLSRMLHENCVNCVRWSPDGALLACAGDECALSVWEYGGRINSAGVIGSQDGANVEKYRQKFRLYGHTLDVLHTEWSKDGRYLASCGMDNSIIIWDAHNFPGKVAVLNSTRSGHTGIVKGVSWDPIGKFLASQSADRTVKIWAIDGWDCVKTIVEPFAESTPTTMFCRMDWSPDGTYLVLPCATNNDGPTAQLVRRKDWDTTLDLVGHRKAVTVVRACPRLLEYTTHKGSRLQVTCFAVGSRDKALSVWLIPNTDRPVVVLHRLFKHSILDFSWNDLHLTICSMDGSVKSIVFTSGEVGRLLSNVEMGEICEKLYSRRLPQYSTQPTMNGELTVGKMMKGAVALGSEFDIVKAKTEEAKKRAEDEAKRKESLMRNRLTIDSNAPSSEMIAKTGPALLPTQTQSEPSEKKEEEVNGKEASVKQGSAVKEQLEPPTRNDPEMHANEQKEIRMKSGKRRIQPIFVASLTAPEEDSPTAEANCSPREEEVMVPVPEEKPYSSGDIRLPLSSQQDGNDMDIDEKEPEPTTSKVDSLRIEAPVSLRPIPENEKVHVVVNSGRSILMSIPRRTRQLFVTVSRSIVCPVDRIEVLNEFQISRGMGVTKVVALDGGKTCWCTLLEPVVCAIAANCTLTVLGCFDRSVYVYSTPCGRLRILLTVDSTPSSMCVLQSFFSVCSAHGYVYVWDAEKNRSILSRCSLGDICEKDSEVAIHRITEDGMPLITFSTNKTFVFSAELHCWQPVNEPSGVVPRISGPLSSLMKTSDSDTTLNALARPSKSNPISTDIALRRYASMVLLEKSICSARALHSRDEYRYYMLTYVRNLVQDGCLSKLREVMCSLCNEDEYVCGIKRNVLMRELVDELKSRKECEEILSEVSSRLGI
uniref:Protein HIRA n=1 Tax=Parascaris univalens TaxID=6257 RepID=A0A915BTP3_PARUN